MIIKKTFDLKSKKPLYIVLYSGFQYHIVLVPKVGLEPTHPYRIRDFESRASANFTTSARKHKLYYHIF